jgi:hypothetical protein
VKFLDRIHTAKECRKLSEKSFEKKFNDKLIEITTAAYREALSCVTRLKFVDDNLTWFQWATLRKKLEELGYEVIEHGGNYCVIAWEKEIEYGYGD